MPKNVKCKNCLNLKAHWCERVIDSPDEDMIRDCQYFCQKTNADRIRAWNDHELAETIANFVSEIDNGDVRYSDDPNDWLKWLQQPAEQPVFVLGSSEER